MQTIIIMILLFITFLLFNVLGSSKKNNDANFFDKNDTLFLKSFWSIIIILVHIPALYQNRIQDLLGSFAYVGVTFFFISSAYGLKYNAENKINYLEKFFSNRIIKLLVPMFTVNFILIILNFIIFKKYSFTVHSFFNAWVIRLLIFNFVFWLFHEKLFKNDNKSDLFTIIFVLLYGILGSIPSLSNIFRWNVESLGFIFGIYLYKHKNIIKSDIKSIIIVFFLSIIAGILYLKFKSITFFGDFLLRTILGFILNYLSFQLIRIYKFGNRINKFIGKISYEMYLCHPGIISIFQVLFPKINSGIFIVLVIFSSIIFSIFVHKLVDRFFGYLKIERKKKNEGIIS